MTRKILDPDYENSYYPNVYWHGTTVGWIGKYGFQVGLNQFGETSSKQDFIWLHSSQSHARNQAEISIHGYQVRVNTVSADPFWGAPDRAARYVYRLEIRPFATTQNMWEAQLSPEKLKEVLKAISKTSLQVDFFYWLLARLVAFFGWLWGMAGTRPRDKILATPNGWFRWLCMELGLSRMEGRDNERWRRLVLFCKNANIDVIKNPKANYHLNGDPQHDDYDHVAEWAIINLEREIFDPKTGKTQLIRTYAITGGYAIWPQKIPPAVQPPQ